MRRRSKLAPMGVSPPIWQDSIPSLVTLSGETPLSQPARRQRSGVRHVTSPTPFGTYIRLLSLTRHFAPSRQERSTKRSNHASSDGPPALSVWSLTSRGRASLCRHLLS